jgi:predicted murein hydrolase (TIGR00659 family)
MEEIINSSLFVIAITIAAYYLWDLLYKRFRYPLLNPVLISILLLIFTLDYLDINVETYNKGTSILRILLDASVVALAFPLYQQWPVIRANYKKILMCMFVGSFTGILSVLVFSWIFGASEKVIISMVPKSVTTPIAVKVSEALGGIPPLTAAVVVTVGIFGSVVGVQFLKLMKITKPESIGLAMGTAAHGLGTATVTKLGERHSAMGGLAIAINGLITALISPYLVEWFLAIVK